MTQPMTTHQLKASGGGSREARRALLRAFDKLFLYLHWTDATYECELAKYRELLSCCSEPEPGHTVTCVRCHAWVCQRCEATSSRQCERCSGLLCSRCAPIRRCKRCMVEPVLTLPLKVPLDVSLGVLVPAPVIPVLPASVAAIVPPASEILYYRGQPISMPSSLPPLSSADTPPVSEILYYRGHPI